MAEDENCAGVLAAVLCSFAVRVVVYVKLRRGLLDLLKFCQQLQQNGIKAVQERHELRRIQTCTD